MSSVKLSKQTVHNNYRGLIVVGSFALYALLGTWVYGVPALRVWLIYGNRSIKFLETGDKIILAVSIFITFLSFLWLEYRYEKKPTRILLNAFLFTLVAVVVWGFLEMVLFGFIWLYG